jgi:hypothetical protein
MPHDKLMDFLTIWKFLYTQLAAETHLVVAVVVVIIVVINS